MEKFTLETARKRAKLTQAEAAKLMDVSKETLSNYERGKTFPDVPVIIKIEEIYGIKYDQIIFLNKNNA